MSTRSRQARKPAGSDLAGNIAAAQRAAERSRTGGVWSLGHLPICWLTLVAIGFALVVIGAVVAGAHAAIGAAVGTAIVGAFFSFSAVVIARVGQRNPRLVLVAALSAYVIKILALGVVLVLMPRDWVVDTRWMAGAVGIGLFGWLAAHMRYVWTTKIFYVDPS